MAGPKVLSSVADLRAAVAGWRRAGETVALVPTMGALHAGHVSLARMAQGKARRVIVSIFVNPTQFAPTEDFSKYPRTFAADCAKLAEAGVDAVYAPTPEVIYPQGFVTTVSLAGPATAGLEDKFRPTHFAGVATVVSKLHIQAMPDIAIYGEKDFQQLAVITRMNRDLDLPITVLGGPTVREADGLALSSRNVYLSSADRKVAPVLHATMQDCARRLRSGADLETVLAAGRAAITSAGFALDYLELRDAASLGPADPGAGHPLRLLVAARIGATRLIDNIAV
ncbi:MAG TPA: pantoate--beta-alanine ligase [Beijerinckiaceae bacterium]|nr:pantoate--beta-alanine ligase [Beijerinckiaceae bacterium]